MTNNLYTQKLQLASAAAAVTDWLLCDDGVWWHGQQQPTEEEKGDNDAGRRRRRNKKETQAAEKLLLLGDIFAFEGNFAEMIFAHLIPVGDLHDSDKCFIKLAICKLKIFFSSLVSLFCHTADYI
jgi:hypothetical protein